MKFIPQLLPQTDDIEIKGPVAKEMNFIFQSPSRGIPDISEIPKNWVVVVKK